MITFIILFLEHTLYENGLVFKHFQIMHVFGPEDNRWSTSLGKPSEGDFDRECPKYTQIGNAVPPFMAKSIGERIKSILSYQ